jgi:hypothetical protein
LLVKARALAYLPPMQRAMLGRDLAGPMRAALGHVVDEAITESVNEVVDAGEVVDARHRSHREVADHLGVSKSRIIKGVTEYRAWRRLRAAGTSTPVDENMHVHLA